MTKNTWKKMLLVLIILLAVATVLLFFSPFSGKNPDANGIVRVGNWEISPFQNDLCVAGTQFEGGAVVLSFIKNVNNLNTYKIAIQSAEWNFPEEIWNKKLPADIKFSDKTQKIKSNVIIVTANRMIISFNESDAYLFKTPTVDTFTIQFDPKRALGFNVNGSLNEMLNELNYCIDRLNDSNPNPSTFK